MSTPVQEERAANEAQRDRFHTIAYEIARTVFNLKPPPEDNDGKAR